MTALLDITTAVKAALETGPPITDGGVQRGRRLPLAKAHRADIQVNAINHRGQALDITGADMEWTTNVLVRPRARASAGGDAESALDELLGPIWLRLRAIVPPAGVTGITVVADIAIDLDEAEETVAVAPITLRVTHITTHGALAA